MVRRLKTIVKAAFESFGYQISSAPSLRGKQCWPLPDPSTLTFFELDERFHSFYDLVQRETQGVKTDNPLRRQRHYTLTSLLEAAALELGDVCEVGCWRGASAYQIASRVKRANRKILFHIFDSFEGLSDLTTADMAKRVIHSTEQLKEEFACNLRTVQENLREFDFIRYYPGWIPNRFEEVKDRTFSFVHVDVGLYQPAYDAVQFFFPRLTESGIMVFNDYGCTRFPGAKKAVDECLAFIEKPFFVPLPSGQAFLIKGL